MCLFKPQSPHYKCGTFAVMSTFFVQKAETESFHFSYFYIFVQNCLIRSVAIFIFAKQVLENLVLTLKSHRKKYVRDLYGPPNFKLDSLLGSYDQPVLQQSQCPVSGRTKEQVSTKYSCLLFLMQQSCRSHLLKGILALNFVGGQEIEGKIKKKEGF